MSDRLWPETGHKALTLMPTYSIAVPEEPPQKHRVVYSGMCVCFPLHTPESRMREVFNLEQSTPLGLKPRYNIAQPPEPP